MASRSWDEELEGYHQRMEEERDDLDHYCEKIEEEVRQEGGTHYSMPIQPIEYIMKNGLGFCEGNVVKYVSRHRQKNGVEDLKKAIHYLEMLIEEYCGG